ncbi:MAG TPA: DUF58 domain-containing protein [Candidatus Sulfomarinibacteraceae bacterium]|nr:DUF58 domain-containing protein [Candidatus Sulfomarinibacteraceae bacterium]
MTDLSFLIITLIVLALLLQVDFIFYIAYVLAGIYLWSRLFTPRIFNRVAFQRHFTDHAFYGERVPVTLSFKNNGRLPIPWLQVSESVPPELSSAEMPNHVLSLRGHEEASFTYEVRATRRGYYRLGPLHLRTGDVFGWAERSGKSRPSFLTVYPRITPLAHLGLPSRLPFGTIASQQRLFEDPARPVGVRDYRAGDSLRQINWKVSAHSNNLVVRTVQPAISLDTAIALNMNLDDYDRQTRYSVPEWAVEVAASIAAHLIGKQQAVGLMTNGIDPLWETQGQRPKGADGESLAFDDASGRLLAGAQGAGDGDHKPTMPTPITPRGGRPHLMKVLELLARVETGRTESLATWLPRACNHLSWGVTVPVITPVAGQDIYHTLHTLVRAGLNPVLIMVTPTHQFGQMRERARRLGFSAYHVTERKDLDEWRRPRFFVAN